MKKIIVLGLILVALSICINASVITHTGGKKQTIIQQCNNMTGYAHGDYIFYKLGGHVKVVSPDGWITYWVGCDSQIGWVRDSLITPVFDNCTWR